MKRAAATGPLPPRAAFPWRALVAMGVALLPTALLAFLLANPDRDVDLNVPLEHFVITTNISAVAAVVGLLVARSALQLRQYPSLLVALGFLSMAGIFVVHGLSTPGVLQRGTRAGDAGLVVAVSAQLALVAAAVFFAIRASPLAAPLARRIPARALTIGVAAALGAYAALGLGAPAAFGGFAQLVLVGAGGGYSYDGAGGSYSYDYAGSGSAPAPPEGAGYLPYLVAAGTVCLYLFAAARQAQEALRVRGPFQGALAGSFLLLAQAEISQVLAPVWKLSWWEYHGLMLAATVFALGAIFVELDRRRGLERFLPPNVVSRIIAGDALHLGGERHVTTILFADLRGSTALAERLAPEAVVDVLNAYLRAMATSVIAEGGILDKFLGDGLMAIFGALEDGRNGAAAAARAALRVRADVSALSLERAARGEPTVAFGVGIHTGTVVLGVVGLPERSDYTAIGDAVNTASRMESLCKELGTDVVLSSDTAACLEGTGIAVRPLGDVAVRGKVLPVTVFTLA
ncbi:MAG: adenylate/guanylate cyclase domain-containing protein [Candidatus Limnocylindria bacterium]|nr:adenylate/guanylate cyclase domain-containing protein [Candidatus Limnocylindria bacterium]